jgi:hypothetical protein
MTRQRRRRSPALVDNERIDLVREIGPPACQCLTWDEVTVTRAAHPDRFAILLRTWCRAEPDRRPTLALGR